MLARASQQRQRDAVRGLVRHLGAVQLDTISVLARSHELVAYARYGAIKRSAIEDAYWGDAASFEYWSHAACILPMDSWPWFAFRRRHYARRGLRWHQVHQGTIDQVLGRLHDEGPLTTREIGGAKRSGEWWDWSDAKIAIEFLLDIGEVVCTTRSGWRRVYDLAARVVPVHLRTPAGAVEADGVLGPDDEACTRQLVSAAAQTIGVGTAADIADVHRLRIADVAAHAADVGLVQVQVQGWKGGAWATPEALDWLQAPSRARHRTTLLSPFDSLVWHRGRTERLFGMAHRLEAYTPSHRRQHGYFAMPVLHRGALVARVDPRRDGGTLVAERVTFESDGSGRVSDDAIAGTATAIIEAATWVGCSGVRVGEVVPASAAPRLRRDVTREG